MAKLINDQLKNVVLLSKDGQKSIAAVQKFLEKAEKLPPLADYDKLN